MAGFRQAVAATIFGFACALRWMHAQFVKPLGTSMDVAFPIVEETVKVRASNDWAAVVLSLLRHAMCANWQPERAPTPNRKLL